MTNQVNRRLTLVSALLPLAIQAQPAPSPLPLSKIEAGTQLPDFNAEWSGQPRVSDAKAYLFDFWATWCAPCIEHFPFLNVIAHSYKPSGLDVIALSKEPGAVVLPFIARSQFKFAVGFGGSKNLQDQLGIKAMPFTVLANASGKVIWSGYATAKLPMLIDQALKVT